MAAVDSKVKVFSFFSFPAGSERRGEEIKRNENDIAAIALVVSQPAFPVERAKKQTRVSDAEGRKRGWGGGWWGQRRARGGLVPTERAR